MLPLLLATAWAADPAGAVLRADGPVLVLELEDGAVRPGERVAVYLTDARPDPRTEGAFIDGLRYAGDARIVWTGEGLVELDLQFPVLEAGGRVVLGPPRNQRPTPAYAPPEPEPEPEPDPPVEVVQDEPVADTVSLPEPEPEETYEPPVGIRPPKSREAAFGGRPDEGTRRRTYFYGDRRQTLAMTGGFAGDGFGTGAGVGALAWQLHPERGLGQIEIGLEGIRGRRWLTAQGPSEDLGRELAVGYWLWSRVDSAGTGLSGFFGFGLGVDSEGLSGGWLIGARTGDPDGTRIELGWSGRGRFGGRLTMDGRVAVARPLRVGLRTRIGDLPRHQSPRIQQTRTDGAFLVSADVSERLTVTGAAGIGGYDLLLRDAGVVGDLAVELRW